MAHRHAELTVDWVVERCRESGLRRTKALQRVLGVMVREKKPMTLAELASDPEVIDQCDKATVYRLLIRLEEKGLLRRLGLHDRSMYFVINIPGSHHDYLICTECGSIDPLEFACPVEALEAKVAKQSGFSRVYHELEFFGVCPSCV